VTLVEAVAGLALLATLLAGLLLAKGRYTRQAALAERRLQAVAAADALLARWWREPARFPRVASGAVDDQDFSWRTRVVENRPLEELAAQVVRLEVLEDRPGPRAGGVLASVDVVLNEPGGRRGNETTGPTANR
jgi:hypothetical protein